MGHPIGLNLADSKFIGSIINIDINDNISFKINGLLHKGKNNLTTEWSNSILTSDDAI